MSRASPCTPRPRSDRARYLDIEFADGRVGATADADRPVATRPVKPVASEPKGAAPKRVVKAGWSGKLVLEIALSSSR